ncbi:hypothetical protein F9K50_00465 [bacterium]|nr:MAG: hypothetical protein F9K50_00465 [bacterium]
MKSHSFPSTRRFSAPIHADSPLLAFEQLALMVMQVDLGMHRSQILEYIRTVLPIVIQLKRGERGHRYISEIYFRRIGTI